MAKETGSETFEVANGASIDEIDKQIEDALRNQYSVGYTPERSGNPGSSYHKINLRAKDRSQAVRTREGYYAR